MSFFPFLFLFACTPSSDWSKITEGEIEIWEDIGYSKNVVLVKHENSLGKPAYFHRSELQRFRVLPNVGIEAFHVPENADVLDVIAELRESGIYEFVEPNLTARLPEYTVSSLNEQQMQFLSTEQLNIQSGTVVNDPLSTYQYNFDQIQINDISSDYWGNTAIVAVIDTGVSAGNDGYGNLISGYDFANNDNDPADDHGHGSHVAGTIGQATNNGIGVRGAAPSVAIMPLKSLGSNGSGNALATIEAIEYAVDNGADIINMSLGFPDQFSAMETGILYALNANVVVVAAAGNDADRTNGVLYPAAYDGVISVSSVGFDNILASYSNAGPEIVFTAPGGDLIDDANQDGIGDGIIQETNNGLGFFDYYLYEGTSMATPHVAGAYAVLMGAGASGSEATTAFQQTALDLGTVGNDDFYGDGLIQVHDALNYYLEQQNGLASVNIGDLVISEIHHDPLNSLYYKGEWFEIYNASASDINLNGMTVSDGASESFIVESDVVLSAGGYVVFAARSSSSENGGISDVDYTYNRGAFKLDFVDTITLKYSTTTFDSVSYSISDDFPYTAGASLTLGTLDATSNDSGVNWCSATTSFGSGDLGTPGSANDECSNIQSISNTSVGDIVISEIHHDPLNSLYYKGEWFEIYNASASDINLNGMIVTDGASESFTVDSNVILSAGGYVVFAARSSSAENGGISDVDYTYNRNGFKLDFVDTITLKYSTTTFDSVSYSINDDFPYTAGASLTLGTLDATSNDSGVNWCSATTSFGSGDLGTPGSANDSCN